MLASSGIRLCARATKLRVERTRRNNFPREGMRGGWRDAFAGEISLRPLGKGMKGRRDCSTVCGSLSDRFARLIGPPSGNAAVANKKRKYLTWRRKGEII